MRELREKPFNIKDLDALGLSEDQLSVYRKVVFQNSSWTVRYKDEVVFCGGVQRIMPSVGEAWLMFSPKGREYIGVLKKAKELLGSSMKSFQRIQAAADSRDSRYSSFLEHLGFTFEGVLRKYGIQGQDMRMYSIVREDIHDSTWFL